MQTQEQTIASLTGENLKLSETFSHQVSANAVMQTQETSYQRQLNMLETQVANLTENLETSKRECVHLREKKRELVRKVEASSAKETLEAREKIDSEVARLNEHMTLDVAHIKRNMQELGVA